MKVDKRGTTKPGNKRRTKKILKPGNRTATRSGTRFTRQKRALEKKKAHVASCATRTVEWPDTHTTGCEKHKLLFMLAIGLIPKYDKKVEPNLFVRLEKMKPEVEAEARVQTENRINEIMQSKQKLASDNPHLLYGYNDEFQFTPLMLLPDEEEPPRVSPENVELIDLVSDDEDEIVEYQTDLYSATPPLQEPHDEDIIDLTSSDDEDSDCSSDDLNKWRISLESSGNYMCPGNHESITSSPEQMEKLWDPMASPTDVEDSAIFSETSLPLERVSRSVRKNIFQQIENHLDQNGYRGEDTTEQTLQSVAPARKRRSKSLSSTFPKRSSPRLSTGKSTSVLSSEPAQSTLDSWMINCRIIPAEVNTTKNDVPRNGNYHRENAIPLSSAPEIVPDFIITID